MANPTNNAPDTADANELVVHHRKRRPGLRDLAQKIGVSHTAVARALRDDPRLTESLRRRVQAVAREEGYLFSDVTKSLITGWSGTIGVIVPRLTSPYVVQLINGIAHQLWEDNTVPMVLCSDMKLKQEEQMLEALGQKRASGVIIMPCQEDRGEDHFAQLLQAHTPIVSLDTALPRLDAPLVSTDDEHGAAAATEHLIERGHRNILHLGRAQDSAMADRRRENGYRRVMEEAGLAPRVLHVPARELETEAVVAELERYFATPAGRETTAVFAFNDGAAFCLYTYARRHGLTLGEDLALVGYGNRPGMDGSIPRPEHIIQPTLSTVEQHPERTGRTAVNILRQLVAGEAVPSSTLIEPELVVRESSRGAAPMRGANT